MTDQTVAPVAAVDELLKQAKIEYKPEFVVTPRPDKPQPIHKYQVHWKIHLGGQVFEYSTGIGHLPKYVQDAGNNAIAEAACAGTYIRRYWWKRRTSVAQPYYEWDPKVCPKAADVIYCLLSDSDAAQYDSFEEWADEFGYDPDSRSAEATYKACVENYLKLVRAVGHQNLEIMKRLLASY